MLSPVVRSHQLALVGAAVFVLLVAWKLHALTDGGGLEDDLISVVGGALSAGCLLAAAWRLETD